MTASDVTLQLLSARRGHGLTWLELSHALHIHHGQASAILSRLHESGQVARLEASRGGSSIYVLPSFTFARRTASRSTNRV